MKKTLSLVLALCLALGLVGLAAAEEVPTLKMITLGSGQPTNYDAWIAHLNPYLEEKLGIHLDVECISWGDWGSRRSVIINANEPYDIIFGDIGNLRSDVAIGAYLDITELLPTSAPDLWSMIPAGYWDACRVGGRIYGVPTYKDSSISQYFVWDVAALEKLGLMEEAQNAHTIADVTPILQAIKEDTGKASFLLTKDGVSQLSFVYDGMGAGLPPVGVRFDDQEAKVVPVFAQDDIMAQLKIVRQWYLDGIINADAANTIEGPSYKPCFLAQGWPAAAKTTWGPNMGIEAIAIQYLDTILSNDSVLGSVNFVSVNTQHPEKALAFINLINTDSKVRDAFYYGLEGENFHYTEDGRVHKNMDASWGMAGYTQGTFFTVTQTDDVDFNQWDEVRALNDSAKPSVLLGFSFDSSNVDDQISNCRAIWDRYHGELLTGTIDPEQGVKDMYDEMRADGFDDIVAEAQAQINAFLGK